MNKKTKQAIIESIEQHERMQKYAKTRFSNENPDSMGMWNTIGESWGSRFCSLCKLFVFECSECPLCIKFGKCGESNVENAWSGLGVAETWEQWLKADEKLVKQLKSLLEK